jgi:hypothetical protein
MEAANRDIIVDIMRIRRNKVVQVVHMPGVWSSVCVLRVGWRRPYSTFPTNGATATVFTTGPTRCEMDNVEPVVVDDGYRIGSRKLRSTGSILLLEILWL